MLRTRIREGAWSPGTVVPPYRSLAKRHRVGAQVVRLAMEVLKAEGLLRPNGRRRLVVARNGLGHNLGMGSILEVIGTNLRFFEGYQQDLQRGIQYGAGEACRPLVIVHDSALLSEVLPDMHLLPVAGIALLSNIDKQVLRTYERLGIPVALVDRPNEGWRMHSVCADNIAAAADTAERILALGHRRIAIVRYASLNLRNLDPDSLERFSGYRNALIAAGVPQKDIAYCTTTASTRWDSPSVLRLFQQRPRPTAILCTAAKQAEMIERAAASMGLATPRNFSLVCFQGVVAEFPHVAGPRIDFETIGRTAINLLAGPREPFRQVRIPTPWTDGVTIALSRI